MTEELKPGPETDARVVIEVMEWVAEYWGHSNQVRRWLKDDVHMHRGGWSPSTDIAAAMNEVLPKLAEDDWSYVVGHDQADGDRRFCRLWKHTESPGLGMKRQHVITRYAETASLAICKAALVAAAKKKLPAAEWKRLYNETAKNLAGYDLTDDY